jgi:radical SAM protein with 4Fe4S-binding SPASM domain
MRNAPDYIQFYPTLRCNRSCSFCFNRSLPAAPDMSFQDFTTLLNKITKLSVKTLDIIGGEPTLHADIVRFVREAEERGLRVNISSNGTNVEVLEKIGLAGRDSTVGVSINDRDTFNHLKRFVQVSKPVVKTVYGPDTDLTLITDILQLHPKRFYLIYRDVMGNDELHTATPFFRFMSSAQQKFYEASNIGTVHCSGFLPERELHPELAVVRCPAGTTKLGVMPDGSAYPCNLFFGKKEFLLGNILTDPFEAIWDHISLKPFRTFSGNKCPRKNCELHTQCHGGCPAHALVLSGDLAAPDPRCMCL